VQQSPSVGVDLDSRVRNLRMAMESSVSEKSTSETQAHTGKNTLEMETKESDNFTL